MTDRGGPAARATTKVTPRPDTHAGLVGRDDVLGEVLDALTRPSGPALVWVGGETGAGRSALLDAAADRLRATDVPVCRVDCLPGDHRPPHLLAHRLLSALGRQPGPARGAQYATEARSSETAFSTALGRALHDHPSPVLVIDDVRYADPESVGLLLSLVPSLTPPSARLLLGMHVPDDGKWLGGSGTPPEIVIAGRAQAVGVVRLSPLGAPDVVRLLTRRLRAAPGEHLTAEVHRLSRGNPAAAVAAVEGFERSGAIRVLLGHAQLVAGAEVPVLPDDSRFVRALRALGEPQWRVAKALSVLEPAGVHGPGPIAAATGLPEDAVRAALADLAAAGHVGRAAEADRPDGPGDPAGPDDPDDPENPRSWALGIPLVAAALRARLLPYERRRVSATYVRRAWEAADAGAGPKGGDGDASDAAADGADKGDAYLADGLVDGGGLVGPGRVLRGGVGIVSGAVAVAGGVDGAVGGDAYLADRIADAGGLVEPERAARELRAIAEQPRFAGRQRTSRWLRAVADLLVDPAARAAALARHASAALRAGDAPVAAAAAEEVLRAHAAELDPGGHQEMAVVRVTALAAAGDMAGLNAVVAACLPRTYDPDGVAAVTGALALCLLGRWAEARGLLADRDPHGLPGPGTRRLGLMCDAAARLMLGDSGDFRRLRATGPEEGITPGLARELTLHQCAFLLGLGELRLAADLMAEQGLTVRHLPLQQRLLAHFLSGAWQEGIATAHSLLSTSLATAQLPAGVLAHARASTLLLAQGRPSPARGVLDVARASSAPMPYLLRAAEAAVHRFLLEPGLAEETLRRGLAEAAAHGHVFGTEELWAPLARTEVLRGSPERAAECLAELRRTADAVGTDGSRLLFLRTCLTASVSHGAPLPGFPATSAEAGEAVALARSSGLPFETARTLVAAASAGRDAERLLPEAYDLFGHLDALVWRYRTRAAMRTFDLPVPGRRTVTQENERLLAALVAEGLTNRQISSVLKVSQVSVESRLNRLFARSGLRSRVELATAVLTGTYP